MTWKTHKALTAFLVMLLTENPLSALFAASGAVLPDALEFAIYGRNVPRWKHRTYTHWPFAWAVAALVFLLFAGGHTALPNFSFRELFSFHTFSYNEFRFLFVPAFFWVSIGALLHCLEDAISGRIPLFNPRRKTFGYRFVPLNGLFERSIFGLSTVGLFLLILERFGGLS